MTTLNLNAVPLQEGTVARFNPKAGFGYVRGQSGANEYIFLVSRLTTLRPKICSLERMCSFGSVARAESTSFWLTSAP